MVSELTADSVRVLWVGVGQCDVAVSENAGIDVRRFMFAFDPSVGEFDVTDRRMDGVRHCAIHSRWQSFGADFQQQLLNRYFTDELLAHRPELIVIDTLDGASMDLVRVGALLGYPVLVRVPLMTLPAAESRERSWLSDSIELAAGIYASGDEGADEAFRRAFPGHAQRVAMSAADAILAANAGRGAGQAGTHAFGYAHYAFGLRDHGLLYRMQLPLADHFEGCKEVLEVACGPGIFLEILRARGIAARGVEREPASVRYGRGLGFDIDEADALDYLAAASGRYDGIYCSHFVEHLDVTVVDRLIGLIAGALRPGGVALFVFPDPESIRSQLLGFWRDPEHVRFYHPDLIELMCRGHGLAAEFHSHRVEGRSIVPFAWKPPLGGCLQGPTEHRQDVTIDDASPGWGERLLARLGIVHANALRRMERQFEGRLAAQSEYTARLHACLDDLEGAVRSLWAVNQTWAWDDNAVVRVRKPL